MARFHNATVTPTKEEALAAWSPAQPWGPTTGGDLTFHGSYRFDDPDGRVGMETFLFSDDETTFQAPLTYRDEPLDGAGDALVCEMEHSVLGTRWVYDGLRDPQYLLMLLAVSLTGQGEALGIAEFEGHWYAVPADVRLQGGGWTGGITAVDGLELRTDEPHGSALANERFELTFFRRPTHRTLPTIGLGATWVGQAEPVALTEVREV